MNTDTAATTGTTGTASPQYNVDVPLDVEPTQLVDYELDMDGDLDLVEEEAPKDPRKRRERVKREREEDLEDHEDLAEASGSGSESDDDEDEELHEVGDAAISKITKPKNKKETRPVDKLAEDDLKTFETRIKSLKGDDKSRAGKMFKVRMMQAELSTETANPYGDVTLGASEPLDCVGFLKDSFEHNRENTAFVQKIRDEVKQITELLGLKGSKRTQEEVREQNREKALAKATEALYHLNVIDQKLDDSSALLWDVLHQTNKNLVNGGISDSAQLRSVYASIFVGNAAKEAYSLTKEDKKKKRDAMSVQQAISHTLTEGNFKWCLNGAVPNDVRKKIQDAVNDKITTSEKKKTTKSSGTKKSKISAE